MRIRAGASDLPVDGASSLVSSVVQHPYWRRPVRMQVTLQPEDDEGRTASTVSLMARYIREDTHDEAVRAAADEAAAGIHAATLDDRIAAEAAAIWRWVREHVQFIEDQVTAELAGAPADAEALIRPADLVRMERPRGDCDDFAMLTAAMLRARGIPAALRTVAAEPSAPDRYSHVYVVAYTPRGELVLDSSHGPRPGWEVPSAGKVKTWSIELMQQSQLGQIDWGAILEKGISTTADIFKARWGQPPPGTYLQRGPQGELFYRQPKNAAPYTFPGGGFGTTPVSLWTIALILAGVAVLAMIARR